jgi:signal peptidase I
MVTVEDVVNTLFVSPSSVRRSFRDLEGKGLIKRTHGGATLIDANNLTPSFTFRTHQNVFEKKLIALKASKLIKEGDVISFFDPAGKGTSVVTHRVNSIITDSEGNRSFKTQGDNNNIEDRIAVPEANLIGVWTEKRIGVIGYVVLFAQKPIGLLVCIFVPVALFVGYEVFQRFKKSKQKQGDIDALRAELEALKAQNSSKEDNNSNGEN